MINQIRTKVTPYIGRKHIWAIGIYAGNSPLNLHPAYGVNNPVLTYKDVTDLNAEFVADPFMIKVDNVWYMFFEVLPKETQQGVIGLATSKNGKSWIYQKIVLTEPFHLSYPYVFVYDNSYYMIPECASVHAVRLYRATSFPTEWTLEKELLIDGDYADASVIHYQDHWYMFVGSGDWISGQLALYHASNLVDHWQPHPSSPLIQNDASIARPAGRIVSYQGKLFRFAQDDYPNYGLKVRAFEIKTLSPFEYEEVPTDPSMILQGVGNGWGLNWNGGGMHHIDAHQVDQDRWLACVDGFKWKLMLK